MNAEVRVLEERTAENMDAMLAGEWYAPALD